MLRINYNDIRKEKIVLFDRELFISERKLRDIMSLYSYAKKHNKDGLELSIQAVTILEQGLKINFDLLKWYELKKRFSLKKVTNKKYLFEKLRPSQIQLLADIVTTLENGQQSDSKKKSLKESKEIK
jgi:hypothetical protein